MITSALSSFALDEFTTSDTVPQYMSHKNKLQKGALAKIAAHSQLLHVEPSQRSMSDFAGALEVVTVERHSFFYEIAADLAHGVTSCPHCGAGSLQLHGRYVVRLADQPYIDESGRVMPVQYAISAQRYQCSVCRKGIVEPLPDSLKPVITKARITRRLSEWLMHEVQTETSYDTLARMTGYSKVWVRKWAQDIRAVTNLPRKPSRPGPKPKPE